jgi:hypothetical protein
VIIFKNMKKLLINGHDSVISQLCSLDLQISIASTPMDVQNVINNNFKVFGEIPKGIPCTKDHHHVIHLQ